MPSRLSKYIRDMQKKGYTAQTIKQQLLTSGYDSFEISQSFKEASGPEVRHVIHLSPATILVVVFAIASIIGGAYFIFSPRTPSTGKLLDLSLQPVTPSAPAGGELVFIQELDNKGSEARFDVEIKHELISSADYRIISTKTETRAIETFGATWAKFLVPQDAKSGDYILRTTASYEDKKAIATLPVKVLGEGEAPAAGPSCFDRIQNQDESEIDCGGVCRPCERPVSCDDSNKCTNDILVNGRCANQPIAPCCGNNRCETNEQQACAQDCRASERKAEKIDYSQLSTYGALDKIKEKASYDPDGAVQDCSFFASDNLKYSCYSNVAEASLQIEYCSRISDAKIKDDCLSNLAKAKLDSSICSVIQGESRRDSCYLTFAIDYKDYSVCPSVSNEQLRDSCNSLSRLGA